MQYRRAILLMALLALSCSLLAVTPQFWENFAQDELLKGTLTRVSLNAEGKLFLAPAYDMMYDTGQPYIFSMVRDKAGNMFLGTGHEGKVFKVDPQGKGSLYFQSKELDVFAVALDASGILYAGTSPDGKVYKVTGSGQSTEFCDPDDKYIWSLLFDDAGNLFVGTGGKGSILKVSPKGEKSTLYDPDDSNVMCLTLQSNGNLLAGTSPGGLLIDVSPQGKAFTLLDTPLEEIRAIAIDRFGTIFAAAVSAKSGARPAGAALQTTGAALPLAAIQVLSNLAEKAQEAKTSVTAPGGDRAGDGARSSIIAVAREGSAETVYSSDDRMIYDLLVRNDGSLLAATGGKGRLISINTAKQVTVVTDSPEEQMTRMLAAGDSVLVAGSNQGKVYRLRSQPAQSGTYESRVMDARVISSWGKVSWRYGGPSGGNLKISTRTGNTEKPDNSWSDWSAPYAASPQQIINPKARYLQWRAIFERGAATGEAGILERIQIAYLQENIRPQVVNLTVLASGIALQKNPVLTSGTVGVGASSTTSDGQSLNAPRQRGKENMMLPPRQSLQPGAQAFTWKATDDNEDSLEYSVYFKGEGETEWKLLEKGLTDTFCTLDGTALPDGVYTLKVVASDAPANAFGKALIGELASKPFVISNATPVVNITNHTFNGRRVEIFFHAKAGAGRIVSAEFSVDGGDWSLVFPTDGIADSPDEDFQIATPELTPGEHLIGLRASDLNGNTGTTKLVVKIQ